MIPMRYSWVRWAIIAIGALVAMAYYYFRLPISLQIALGFLLVLTATSWIVPPGIYGWLLGGMCPTCGKRVEWVADPPADKPYQERIIVRCPGCGMSKVEWEYLPT